MTRYRVWAILALLAGVLLAYFVWATQANPDSAYRFKLGLDLAGGTELVYKADMSQVTAGNRSDALAALQQVIERRVNLFGVAEPVVQTEAANAALGTTEDRLIVDLPGVTDINAAVAALGATPTLDFELATTTRVGTTTAVVYEPTGLTGQYLKSASVQFASGVSAALSAPQVEITFNSAGAKLFEQITAQNVGQTLAIFLDGQPISTPTIQEAIPGGTAVITGSFTATEARDLARNLN
ncbi:MAG: preprotein translocase subunit SecD, partial [Minisyncoccia bacterium]